MMRVIVPVKSFLTAKTRLSGVFEPVIRAELARALACNVLCELVQVRGLDRVLVVTSEPQMLQHCRDLQVDSLWDDGTRGLNGALYAAEMQLGLKDSTIAVVCADIPFFRADEFARMMAEHLKLEGMGLTLASDHAGVGTNVRIVTSSLGLPYLYGENSAASHLRVAHEHGLRHQKFTSSSFALDLDTPDNVIEVMRRAAIDGARYLPVSNILVEGFQTPHREQRSWTN